MLDRDVVVLELLGRLRRAHEHLLEALRDVDLPGLAARPRHARPALELARQTLLERLQRHAHLLEEPRREAVLLAKQRRKRVPGVDLGGAVLRRDRLSLGHGFPALLRELLEVHVAAKESTDCAKSTSRGRRPENV